MTAVESTASVQDFRSPANWLTRDPTSVFDPDREELAPQNSSLVDTYFGGYYASAASPRRIDNLPFEFPTPPVDPSSALDLSSEFDAYSQFMDDLEQKKSITRKIYQAYRLRINGLRSAGALEGVELNERSEEDFWSFIRSSHFSRRAGLALMDNGNIRAVWKGEDESHLGLHFLGDRQMQYVIFKRRSGSSRISRTAGIDTVEGIKKQIGAFDLMSLVNA